MAAPAAVSARLLSGRAHPKWPGIVPVSCAVAAWSSVTVCGPLAGPAAADQADKIMLIWLAGMEVRRPGEKVAASFTSEAGEDPLGSVP